MSLAFKFIGPKGMSTASLRAQLLNAGKWTAKKMKRALEDYTSTWETVEPEFRDHCTYEGGNIFAVIELPPDGGAPVRPGVSSNQIFLYLNFGTDVRHAIMSPDFQRKTQPNSLKSGTGAGGVMRVSRKYQGEGIEARNTTQLVSEIGVTELSSRVAAVINSYKIDFSGGV